MKNLFILWLAITSLLEVNAQTYRDSANNLDIVKAVPNACYVDDIIQLVYIPQTNFEFNWNPEFVEPTNTILSERYGCVVELFENTYDNNLDDPLFVVYNEGTSIGYLILPISIVEEFHQRGALIDQVDKFGYYSDMLLVHNE